jgi:large subunit ribosomal protein L28
VSALEGAASALEGAAWGRPIRLVAFHGCPGRPCRRTDNNNVIEPGIRQLCRRIQMASKCEVCGKGPSWGMSVSHSHRRTKRRWNPNIQRVRASVNGASKRVNVCTGCIKSGKIVKAS